MPATLALLDIFIIEREGGWRAIFTSTVLKALLRFSAGIVTMAIPSGVTDDWAVQTDEPGRLDNHDTKRNFAVFERVLADTARRREVNAKREAALSLKKRSMVSGDLRLYIK